MRDDLPVINEVHLHSIRDAADLAIDMTARHPCPEALAVMEAVMSTYELLYLQFCAERRVAVGDLGWSSR